MLRRTIPVLALLFLSSPGLASGLDEPQEALRLAVESLAESPTVGDEPVTDFRLIGEFYARREFRPAWTDEGRIAELMQLIRSADQEGLRPEDYHLAHLEALLAVQRQGSRVNPARAAELDIVLTDALARYGYHLRFGKVDPTELDAAWNLSRTFEATSPAVALQGVIDSPNLADAVAQPYMSGPTYQAYRTALDQYRRIRDAGGWPAVPAGPTLKPGMDDPRVPVIRAFLDALGESASGSSPASETYDDEVAAAVERFQQRHGLDADGVLGPATLAAMNVPVQARIDQLRVNMERIRWVFRDIEDDFILVNIAGFKAHLVRDRRIAWSTRVMVGRPYRQTPVFKSTMTYLVFNPTWTVPPGILRKDVLPKVRADVGYLAANHMEVIDSNGRAVDPGRVDWSGNRIPYQIRQKPGPWNAMGLVKFMFPNEYLVFLHDTPSRSLFDRPERTFSSGCIRTENPFDLAELLLEGQAGWDRAAIDALVASGETRTVVLEKPITVMLLYGTVGFDPDWGVVFYRDVYDRDGKILEELDEGFRFRPPAGYTEATG